MQRLDNVGRRRAISTPAAALGITATMPADEIIVALCVFLAPLAAACASYVLLTRVRAGTLAAGAAAGWFVAVALLAAAAGWGLLLVAGQVLRLWSGDGALIVVVAPLLALMFTAPVAVVFGVLLVVFARRG